MTKTSLKNLAEEAIVLLREMFGEGIEFDCTEYFKSNEALTGIALHLPGCSSVPVVCLDDMPDNATAEDIANIAATTFQEALRSFKELPILPEMTKENILENVVLQALSRKRNRQLLKSHPHITLLDLAGVFRVPVGPYKRNSLSTMLITNQIMEKLGLTIDELTEAARKNTVAKFGIEFENAHRMGLCSLLHHPWTPEPFETVSMSETGLYVLSTSIRVNGAALILLPDILEKIGEKAGMDYYLIPSSIHELLIARDDGLVTPKLLKEIVYEGNRTDAVIKQEDVLSDNIYFYSRTKKSLKIA